MCCQEYIHVVISWTFRCTKCTTCTHTLVNHNLPLSPLLLPSSPPTLLLLSSSLFPFSPFLMYAASILCLSYLSLILHLLICLHLLPLLLLPLFYSPFSLPFICLASVSPCLLPPLLPSPSPPPSQAITVLTALTLARDEVFWLFKHNNVNAPKGKHRPNPDDYNDPALPELIFQIVQLKGMYIGREGKREGGREKREREELKGMYTPFEGGRETWLTLKVRCTQVHVVT